jgi:two-component system, sensor histidine kinase and response regulator
MRRILVVDDNTTFVNALAEMLRVYQKDALVETASSAEEALALFAVAQYDAIISDFRLSGMDGFAFLEKCKVLQPNTPVVMITGYGDVEMERQAARRGAYAFLHKPIDADVLTSVVARATLTANLSRPTPPLSPFSFLHRST